MNNLFTKKMSTDDFDDILEDRIKDIRYILSEKAKEYSRNEDRLHNFNVGSKISGDTRERVLWNGFALKHLVSVKDIVDDLDSGVLCSEKTLKEKVGDLINYLILLEACLLQRIDHENDMGL